MILILTKNNGVEKHGVSWTMPSDNQGRKGNTLDLKMFASLSLSLPRKFLDYYSKRLWFLWKESYLGGLGELYTWNPSTQVPQCWSQAWCVYTESSDKGHWLSQAEIGHKPTQLLKNHVSIHHEYSWYLPVLPCVTVIWHNNFDNYRLLSWSIH